MIGGIDGNSNADRTERMREWTQARIRDISLMPQLSEHFSLTQVMDRHFWFADWWLQIFPEYERWLS